MRLKIRAEVRRLVAFILCFVLIVSGVGIVDSYSAWAEEEIEGSTEVIEEETEAEETEESTETEAESEEETEAEETEESKASSKKGLQLDNPGCMDQALELGCSSIFLNVRVSDFMYTEDIYSMSESFTVDDVTYYMDVVMLNHYMEQLEYGTENGIEEVYLQIYAEEFAGMTDTTDSSAYFHAFDMSTDESVEVVRNVFEIVCKYMGEYADYWIIGNEVNNSHVYYESGTDDLSSFVTNYEATMRLMYDVSSEYNPDVCVMACFDHEWTSTDGDRFSTKDILDMLAQITAEDDYNWGVAIHPYSEPLLSAAFWDDYESGATYDEDTARITMYNLDVFTDFMQDDDMLYGDEVRHIAITEIGYNALENGVENQELQAAAFIYAYYIAEANEYIDSFQLRSYQDNETESAVGLKFGLFDMDGNEREIYEVFKYIDTIYSHLLTDPYLSYLGASSWNALIDGFENVTFTKEPETAPVDLTDIALGDVNMDGDVNYLDAMQVLRYDARLITFIDEQLNAADVNGDGSVDSLDAILILRYDAKLIESFEGVLMN